MAPSKKQVNKAGKLLRNWFSGRGPVLVSPSDTDRAFEVVSEYRRQWVEPPHPYATFYARLFEMAQEAGEDHVVTRRLKRIDRMILKLTRHPTMALTTMEDIAGCRVVVPSLVDLRVYQERMSARWEDRLQRVRDYIEEPRDTGYRAVHLTVSGHGLPVEVQLRTRRQQQWAQLVEFLEDRDQQPLKDGEGDSKTLTDLRLLAEYLADLDGRGVPADDIAMEIDRWRG